MYKSELSKEEFYKRVLQVIRSGFIQGKNVSNRKVARAALEGTTICLSCGHMLGRDYDGRGETLDYCAKCLEE